jgi:hypothetical protein
MLDQTREMKPRKNPPITGYEHTTGGAIPEQRIESRK